MKDQGCGCILETDEVSKHVNRKVSDMLFVSASTTINICGGTPFFVYICEMFFVKNILRLNSMLEKHIEAQYITYVDSVTLYFM